MAYGRNYLSEVIVRVDFVSPPPNTENDLPSPLLNLIAEQHPIRVDPVVIPNVRINTAPDGTTTIEPAAAKQMDFQSRDRRRSLRWTPGFLCLMYGRDGYTSFDGLLGCFMPIVDKVVEIYGDSVAFSRLGLRYVDTIDRLGEGDPLEWSEWVKPEYLQFLSIVQGDERALISRAIQRLELNYGDIMVRAKWGIDNPDYPAAVRRRQFLFDTDVFERALIEAGTIRERLLVFKDIALRRFEALITDAFRAHLNE